MKKIVAIAAFLFINTMLLFAQENIRFGFHLSPNLSWATTSSNSINTSGTNLGLKLGMIGEFYFQENYAFTSGIGFAFNQGGTLLYDFGGQYWPASDLPAGFEVLPANVKLKYSLQYLEIPIGLKMRTKEFGYIRYFIEPGLIVGISTQSKGSITGPGLGNDADKINISNEVNSLNVSWGIGGGIEHTISENVSLIGGLGFQIGFLDVSEDNGKIIDPSKPNLVDEDSKDRKSVV